MGFPLEALSYLRCPLCGEELKLKDGVLDRESISSTKLYCSACNEELEIVDGILSPLNFWTNIKRRHPPLLKTIPENGVTKKNPPGKNSLLLIKGNFPRR